MTVHCFAVGQVSAGVEQRFGRVAMQDSERDGLAQIVRVHLPRILGGVFVSLFVIHLCCSPANLLSIAHVAV